MKKRIQILLTAVLVLLLAAMIPAGLAFAYNGIEYALPVKTIVEGGFPQTPEKFSLVLEADEPDFPMPKEAVDGVCTLTLSGKDAGEFPTVLFDKLGFYSYTVRQIPGKAADCHYDKTVYQVLISVTNKGDNEDGYEINVAVNQQGKDEKCDGVVFRNVYDYPKTNIPKTGDQSLTALYMGIMIMSALGVAVILPACTKKN